MKALKRVLAVIAAVAIGSWVVVQFMGRNAPPGLGPTEDGLAECPDTPNCVCSDCEQSDKLPPLEFSSDPAVAKAALKAALAKMKIEVVAQQENYVHAIAVTPIMRYRDDLEFLIQPEEKKIQVRSASRLGKSDLGKNRARLKEIFALLEKEGIRAGKADAAN
ncbi:MAG TPA: DUF1499 domain-containing protein [Verrucomicrobiae bacterium]|nr:DUF1499 domain-containing protein [Verrucomicrobiae bacterium]